MSVKDIQNSIYNVSDFYKTTQLGQGTGYVNGFTSGHTSGYVSGYAYKPFRVPVKEFSYKPQEQKQESNLFVANYNDPSQINSIADVIYSRKGIINASLELLKNTWNPILHKNEKGEWDPQFVLAAVNSLVNVGETFDIFANPVKGLFQEGFTGLKKATIGDASGRYNYDWDIDPEHKWDGLINLGLEFISDPVNLATLGVSGSVKSVGKSFSKSLLNDGVDSLSKQIIKSAKGVGRTIAKDVAEKHAKEAIINAAKRTFVEFTQKTAKELGEETAENFIKRTFINNVKDFIANKQGIELTTNVASSRLGLQFNKSLNEASINIVKSLRNINRGAKIVDSTIFKTAMTTTGVYPVWKIAAKVNPKYAKLAKQIADKAILTVAQSPVASGVKDAYSTVRAMLSEIDINTDSQELLKMLDADKITLQDLSDITIAKANKHMAMLKKAIKENGAKNTTEVLTVVNATIKKETGFESLDEYIASLSTLLGQCSRESEYALFKLKKFKEDILRIDKKEKITATNKKIKNTIKALNITPKALDVTAGTTRNTADTIVKAIDTMSTLKISDFETPDRFGRIGVEKHGAMLNNIIELTRNINTKQDLNIVEESVLRYLDDVKDLQIYYDEDIFASIKTKFMDAVYEATENIKNIDNCVERFQLTTNHVYDFITERSLLGESNEEIKNSLKQLFIKKIPQVSDKVKVATEKLYNMITDFIDEIPEELNRHSAESIKYLLHKHIPIADTFDESTKKFIQAPVFSNLFLAAKDTQKELKQKITTQNSIKSVLNWYNPQNSKGILDAATESAKDTLQILEKLSTENGIERTDNLFSLYLMHLALPVDDARKKYSILYGLFDYDGETTISGLDVYNAVIKTLQDTLDEDVKYLENKTHYLPIKKKDRPVKFDEYGNPIKFKTIDIERVDTSKSRISKEYEKEFRYNRIKEALDILQSITNPDSLARIDYAVFEEAYNTIVGDIEYFNILEPDIQDYLNSINPQTTINYLVELNSDAVYYQLKGEQMYNIAMYLSDEKFMDTISGLANRTSRLGQYLDNMAHSVANNDEEAVIIEYANRILTLADNFEVYCTTFTKFNQLAEDGILNKQELIALQSAIQKQARENLFDVSNNLEQHLDRLYTDIENYYNYSFKYDRSFSVESIIGRNPVYKDTYGIVKETHNSADDARVEFIIAHEESELKGAIEEFEKKGYRIVALDLESSGLDKTYDKILEVSLYDGTNTYFSPIKYATKTEALTALPQPSVLKKTFSEFDTYNKRVDAFVKRYTAADGEKVTNLTEYYTELIQNLFKNGDNVVILTHNGSTFDIPFLISQFEKYDVAPDLIEKFKSTIHFDNVVEFRKAHGYCALDETKKKAIKDIVKEHIDSLALKTDYNYFFDAGIVPFRKTIREQLQALSESKIGQTESLDQLQALGEDTLNDAVKVNAINNKVALDRIAYTNELKDLQQIFSDIAQVSYNFADSLPLVSKATISNMYAIDPTLMDFIDVFGENPTLSTLFYNNDNIINLLGYKSVINSNVILDWFSFSEGSKQDINLMKYYTKIGYSLNNQLKYARNITLLKDEKFVAQLLEYAKILQNNLPEHGDILQRLYKNNINLEALSPAELYTITTRLHKLSNTSLDEATLAKVQDAFDAIEYRLNSNLNYNNMSNDVVAYDLALSRIRNDIDLDTAIKDVERTKGVNKIYTAKKQYIASALRRTYSYTEKIKNKIQGMSLIDKARYKKFAAENLDELCVTQTASIITKSPDDLFNYMLDNRAPIMFYTLDDNIQLKALTTELYKNKDLYNTKGIDIVIAEGVVCIKFNNNVKFDYYVDDLGFHVTTADLDRIIDYSKNAVLDFTKFDEAEDLTLIYKEIAEITNGMSLGHLGNSVSEEQVKEYISALPKVIRDSIDIAAVTKSTMFTRYTFDSMNIGSLASRQKFNQYMPSDLTKLIINYNPKIVQSANKRNLMLDYWLNKDMSVTQFINYYGEEQVKRMLLNSGEYKVMMLTTDKKRVKHGFYGQGYRVIELDPNNEKLWDIAKDEAQGAIIVPSYMYADIYDSLNSSILYDNPAYQLMHQWIYKTKLGLISTVGKVYRDVIEGQLKNMLETRDALGILKNDVNAVKQMRKYDEAVKDILNLSKIDYDKLKAVGIDPADFAEKYINNRFEAEKLVQQYYASLKDVMKMDAQSYFLQSNKELYFNSICKSGMDINTFDTLHAILTESGTLGELPRWANYTKQLHTAKQQRFAEDYVKGLIGDKMIEKPKNIFQRLNDSTNALFNLIMSPAQYLDRVNRIAEYLTFVDTGLVNPASALSRVARTHFDSALKSDSELLIELAIPFYSFFKHNIMYWAKTCMEQPWAAKTFADYIESIQSEEDLGDVSDFERRNNVSLMSAKLAGNIILTKPKQGKPITETRYTKYGKPYTVTITPTQDQVVLKMNLPFMEAYQACINPIGYFASATNPAISLALQSWIGNNPKVPQSVSNILDIYRPYNIDEGGKAKLQGWMLIPGVGPILQKWGPDGYAKEQYKQTGFLGNLVMPSLFGRLNRFNKTEVEFNNSKRTSLPYRRTMSLKQFQFINKYGTNPNFSKQSYTPKKRNNKKTYKKATNYYKKYYGSYTYSNKLYPTNYVKHYSDSYVKHNWDTYKRAYPQRIVKRAPSTFYKRLYFPNGMAKVQRLGLPRKVKNPNYVIRNLFSYTR